MVRFECMEGRVVVNNGQRALIVMELLFMIVRLSSLFYTISNDVKYDIYFILNMFVLILMMNYDNHIDKYTYYNRAKAKFIYVPICAMMATVNSIYEQTNIFYWTYMTTFYIEGLVYWLLNECEFMKEEGPTKYWFFEIKCNPNENKDSKEPKEPKEFKEPKDSKEFDIEELKQ